MKINYYVDDVMKRVCELLKVEIPDWKRPIVVLDPLSGSLPPVKFPLFEVDPELCSERVLTKKRSVSPDSKTDCKKVLLETKNL